MLFVFLVTIHICIRICLANSTSHITRSTQYLVTRVPKPFNISANSTIRIYSPLKENEKFLVFEAHCRTSYVLMSWTDIANDNYVNSTSPALVYDIRTIHTLVYNDVPPGVHIHNPHSYDITVLAMGKAYTAEDPVPGKCTTKNPHPKPFLSIDWNLAVIRLNFTRASRSTLECNDPHYVKYRIYQRYLSRDGWGYDTRDQQFREALKTFNEEEDIGKWGQEVKSLGPHMDRLIFASYPPMGSLYAVIAETNNGSSMYALGHTYGCQVDPVTGVCPDTTHTVTKVACAIIIFTGLVMAFAGHRFFMVSQFLFGFYAGSFMGYILLSINFSLEFVELFSLTTMCGLIMASMMSALWFFLGIPVLSVLLPTLEVGVISSSCILFLPQMNIPSLTTDLYFWLVFLCLMLAIPIFLLAFTQKASIISSVIVGSTSIILPVDYFLGTGLRFIFINVTRRAIHPRFKEALVLPSLQTEDLMLVACWLALAAAALLTQLLMERRRPPFPPAPFQQWRWRREINMEGEEGETSPLLSEEEPVARAEAVSSPVVGYILGHRPVTGIAQVRPVTGIPPPCPEGQQRGRTGGVITTNNSSARSRDIFKPPTPEENVNDYFGQHYSPRQQGIEWGGAT